jgi:hypothetical protein
MLMADLILSKITAEGYVVEDLTYKTPGTSAHVYRATHPTSGESWTVSEPARFEAALELAIALGVDIQGSIDAMLPLAIEASTSRKASKDSTEWLIPPVLAAIGVIFLLDVAIPGVNLGMVYILPLSFVVKNKMRLGWILLFTGTSVGLIALGQLLGQGYRSPELRAEPSSALNRSFDVFAILSTTTLMVLFRYWKEARAQTDQRPRTWRWKLAMLPYWMPWAVTWTSIVVIFTLDLVTIHSANLPILYFVPLVLVAISYPARRLWPVCLFLLTLLIVAYWASSFHNFLPEDAQLILLNRFIAGASLVLFTLFFGTRKLETLTSV